MMSSRCQIHSGSAYLCAGDDCQVGQVGPSSVGMVGQNHITNLYPSDDLLTDCCFHGAQVDWEMGCVGQQFAVPVKDAAGEVKSLPDIGADWHFLEDFSHLLGYGHEAGGVEGQFDRVGFCYGSVGELMFLVLLVVEVGEFVGEVGCPVRFD